MIERIQRHGQISAIFEVYLRFDVYITGSMARTKLVNGVNYTNSGKEDLSKSTSVVSVYRVSPSQAIRP